VLLLLLVMLLLLLLPCGSLLRGLQHSAGGPRAHGMLVGGCAFRCCS
jgi:hypothetical protein